MPGLFDSWFGKNHKHSTEEVCKTYQPSAELVEEIESLPLVQRLLTDNSSIAFRPSLAPLTEEERSDPENYWQFPGGLGVPKNDKSENLDTWKNQFVRGTTLYGQHKIEYALQSFNEFDNVLINVVRFGDAMCGHNGLVHGGLISAFFDDSFGTVFLLASKGQNTGVTANLNINYRAPMPAGSTVAFVLWIDREEGSKKVFLKAEARSIPTEESDATLDETATIGEKAIGPGSIKFAEATALFIKLDTKRVEKMAEQKHS